MICAVGAVLRNISAIPDGVSKIFSSDELIKLIVALFRHADLMARTQAQRVIKKYELFSRALSLLDFSSQELRKQNWNQNDPFWQASYVIANLLRHNDETFIQRQKVLRGAGLLTAIHQSSSDCVRPINTSKLVIFSDFLKNLKI